MIEEALAFKYVAEFALNITTALALIADVASYYIAASATCEAFSCFSKWTKLIDP